MALQKYSLLVLTLSCTPQPGYSSCLAPFHTGAREQQALWELRFYEDQQEIAAMLQDIREKPLYDQAQVLLHYYTKVYQQQQQEGPYTQLTCSFCASCMLDLLLQAYTGIAPLKETLLGLQEHQHPFLLISLPFTKRGLVFGFEQAFTVATLRTSLQDRFQGLSTIFFEV